MSCAGYSKNAGIFPALFALLQWTFCEIFDTPHEKRCAIKECIAHTCWANEAIFGDEISYHDKAVRESKKILAPVTPEMSTAIEALACVVQILHRQGKISVKSEISDKTALLTVICQTNESLPRGEVIQIIDKNTLCIKIQGKKE